MSSEDRAFLRLHVMAVWGVTMPRRFEDDLTLTPASDQPFWRLCAAELAEERILIWRADTTEAQRAAALARLAATVATNDQPLQRPPGIQREVALRLDAEPRLSIEEAQRMARPLTRTDADLIDEFWPGEAEDALRPEAQPAVGVVVQQRLVSMAHASRRIAGACELGIETQPDARRKGYALAATVAWSQAVIAEGLTPIYSASAHNTASLRLAEAAGYRVVARVTLVEDELTGQSEPERQVEGS